MFAFTEIETKRAAAVRRVSGLLIVGAASLLLGACAHNVADAPGLQWQVSVNAADAQEEAPAASAGATSSLNCGHDSLSGECYVYRGGRDPITGLALTQL